MKIISTAVGKYKCPYCLVVAEVESQDLQYFGSVVYYKCPTCKKYPRIQRGKFSDRFYAPAFIDYRSAKKVD